MALGPIATVSEIYTHLSLRLDFTLQIEKCQCCLMFIAGSATVPEDWNVGNVAPIFKRGSGVIWGIIGE